MLPAPQVRALAVRLLLAHAERLRSEELDSATPRALELRSTVLVLAVSTDSGISVVSASEISTMISTISSFSGGPSSGVAVSVSAVSVSDSARRCGGDLAGLGGMGVLGILTRYRMAIACPTTWA